MPLQKNSCRRFRLVTLLVALLGFICTHHVAGAATFLRDWGPAGSESPQIFGGAIALAVDSSGTVYVAEAADHRVLVFDSQGTFLRMWGTAGSAEGQFTDLRGIAVDNQGYVYTTEFSPSRVQKFTTQGGFLTSWHEAVDDPSHLSLPSGIDVGANGNVYVLSAGNSSLQVYDPWGDFLWGMGAEFGSDIFGGAQGVAAASTGDAYVSHEAPAITHLGSTGTVLNTIADGEAVVDRLAVAPNGNIIAMNFYSSLIRIYSPAGTLVESWSGPTTGPGQIQSPRDVDVDGSGVVYLLDAARVKVFSSSSTPVQGTTWSSLKATGGRR